MILLALFSTLMMHSIIPHVHHTHTDLSSIEANHHHSHDDNWHKHSKEDKAKDQGDTEGPLGLKLGYHSHAGYNADFRIEVRSSLDENMEGEKWPASAGVFAEGEGLLTAKKKEAPPLDNIHKSVKPFLLSCSLRAPPSLA
jgi:hypothetical protein